MAGVINWIGGKARISKHILPYIPRHKHYIEPFCGSLAVFFAKKRSQYETINDSDSELVNFWETCRDEPYVLLQELAFTPYSREIRRKFFQEPIPKDPVKRAARFFYICNTGFAGKPYDSTWGYRVAGRPGDILPTVTYWKQARQISVLCKRLAHVQIECRDFAVIIERFSNDPYNFIYIDPPYFDTKDYYQDSMSIERHRELAELVKGNKSPIMISYHQHEMLDELYPGWVRVRLDSYESVSKRRGNTVEVLLMNYKLVK